MEAYGTKEVVQPKNENGETKMAGITTEDWTTNRMMNNLDGGRLYNPGYGTGTPASYANLSAIKDTIISGNRANAAGIENLLDQNQFEATNKNITDGHARICETLTNSEFRQADRLRDIEREMSAYARENERLHCATQKEIAVNQGQTNAQLSAIEAKIDANKEISELRAQLETQKVLVGTNNGCGVGTIPCTPCS